MSDTQPQSYLPTAAPARKRTTSLWVWALVLVVAVAALTGAVWWVGGPDAALKAVGLNGFSFPQFGLPSFSGQSPQAPGGQPVSPSAVTTATSLPPEAQDRMFTEQVESRAQLSDLVAGRIASFSVATSTATEDSASVPITAAYSDGSVRHGTIHLARFGKTWYFFSLSAGSVDAESGETTSPAGFDASVVSAITEQQALPATQELISSGLLGGGFTQAKVDTTSMGERTATVDLTLSGGTQPDAKARLVCVSKTDTGIVYWFVAKFEKR